MMFLCLSLMILLIILKIGVDMFYNFNYDFNNCISMGACSVSPNISSMQELMQVILRQIAYYISKLKEFNVEKEDISYNLILEIAYGDAVKDLSEAQILNAFSKEYNNLVHVRKDYLKLCKEKGLVCTDLKHLIKLSPKTSLSEILKMGDREFLQKYKKVRSNQKYFSEILYLIMKSVCSNIILLKDFGEIDKNSISMVTEALNLFNNSRINTDTMKKMAEVLATCDIELLRKINDLRIEKYGYIEKTVVSHSTQKGKAILVSGSNLHDLDLLLNAVKDSDIAVYTNGNLLIAHAFPYFKRFKNLKGHFGTGTVSTILDFATFPGAILLTKNESQNIEYLYRGRLFTTDKIAPKGVVKIVGNDFSELISSALQAKGFAKGQKREPQIVGYDSLELDLQINKIFEKNPERIYIIGLSNLSVFQKDYFNKFYSLIGGNDVVVTFSYNPNLKNVFAYNLGDDYSLLYEVLHKIFDKIPLSSSKLMFFLTKCDINSLSNIINLKNNGAKQIFLSDCPPTVVNPAVLRAFAKFFEIKNITTPENDLQL